MAEEPKLEIVAPVFPVTDVKCATDYFTSKLLFDIAFEWADEDGGPVSYVILRSGNCELHLTMSEKPHKTIAYFFVRGVEEYHDAVRSNGATITQDIKDWPWNMREFEVADPDGNRLIFGQDISRIKDGAAGEN